MLLSSLSYEKQSNVFDKVRLSGDRYLSVQSKLRKVVYFDEAILAC